MASLFESTKSTWLLLSAAAGVVAARWIAKRLFLSHPLDKIRGPTCERWIQGILFPFLLGDAVLTAKPGNRPQMWDPVESVKFMQTITKEYGGVVRLNGVLGTRELFVSDPLALQSISSNNISVWQMPSEVLATNSVLFGEGLPGTTGEVHHKHRKELMPVFSKSHIQELIPVFYSVARKLRDALRLVVQAGPREVDLLPWAARVALELVGQGGLGHSFDKFTDDTPDEYASAVKNLLPQLFRNPVARMLAPFFPLPVRRFLAQNIPSRNLQELAYIVRVMDENSKKLLSSRKASLFDNSNTEQVGFGKDLITILLRGDMRGSDFIKDSDLLGHINALIFGAVDTTSSAFSSLFHILAQNPDMQDRIREEGRLAREERGAEELDFKALANMTYTDAFIREVLRLHAPVPALLRRAIKDTVLPLKYPIIGRDGEEIHEVFVPARTTIFISILIPNTSTQTWGEDALEFKPERWLSPLPNTVVNSSLPGIYSHMMTFWAGTSACLFQFAVLEMKVVILLLLSSFRFSLADQDIAWRSSGLQFPSLAESGSLALPLDVEAL